MNQFQVFEFFFFNSRNIPWVVSIHSRFGGLINFKYFKEDLVYNSNNLLDLISFHFLNHQQDSLIHAHYYLMVINQMDLQFVYSLKPMNMLN